MRRSRSTRGTTTPYTHSGLSAGNGTSRSVRVALVHDWLVSHRGGENVLEEICALYPEADVFTLIHQPGSVSSAIERHRISTSFLQRIPGIHKSYRQYLPLFPTAIESLD